MVAIAADRTAAGAARRVVDAEGRTRRASLRFASRGAARAAHTAGKTPEDAAASLTLPEKFKAYNMGRTTENIATIYEELKAVK